MSKKYTRKLKQRKFKQRKITHHSVRKGGQNDIEMGPEPSVKYMKDIPPDPKRFDDYDYKIAKREIERSGSPDETEAFFDGPNPEEKKEYELNMMSQEDPLNKEPFAREELNIFNIKGGKRDRKNGTKNKKTKKNKTNRKRIKNKNKK